MNLSSPLPMLTKLIMVAHSPSLKLLKANTCKSPINQLRRRRISKMSPRRWSTKSSKLRQKPLCLQKWRKNLPKRKPIILKQWTRLKTIHQTWQSLFKIMWLKQSKTKPIPIWRSSILQIILKVLPIKLWMCQRMHHLLIKTRPWHKNTTKRRWLMMNRNMRVDNSITFSLHCESP